MNTKSLRKELEGRAGSYLHPGSFTNEMLTAFSKLLNDSSCPVLNEEEKSEIVNLLVFWIEKITEEQSPEKHAFFINNQENILWGCVAQLEYLLHEEIVFRQIQVPGRSVKIHKLFTEKRLHLRREKLPTTFTSIPNS